MKKKYLIAAVAIMLVAALAVGGTLAYMTDRDEATNTFTVGNVDITLNEVYTDNSQLMPGVEINKDITIANTGINNAYVWYTFAIPTELVPYLIVKYEENTAWTAPVKVAEGKVDKNGVSYTVFVTMYTEQIAKGNETALGMTSVTMSPYIDIDPQGNLHSVQAGVVTDINWNYQVSPVIYVNAYGIQVEGFANVQEAYDAYIGQWAELQLSWAV